MAVAPEIRIIFDIIQIIVHKAHIPLQVKAQPVVLQRSRNLRECSTLLRNGKDTGIPFLHDGIQMLDQFDGFQVLLSAVHIGNPFPILFTVIQIKHTRHSVHPDAVRVVFFHPEQSIRDQVIGDLGPAVIVNQCPPMRMAALSGIQMLIETGTVKMR